MPDELPEHRDRRLADYRLQQVEQGIAELRRQVDEGFRTIRSDMASLGFVRADVHTVEHASLHTELESVTGVAEQAKAIAMWALGLLASGVVGAVIIAVARTLG